MDPAPEGLAGSRCGKFLVAEREPQELQTLSSWRGRSQREQRVWRVLQVEGCRSKPRTGVWGLMFRGAVSPEESMGEWEELGCDQWVVFLLSQRGVVGHE